MEDIEKAKETVEYLRKLVDEQPSSSHWRQELTKAQNSLEELLTLSKHKKKKKKKKKTYSYSYADLDVQENKPVLES